MATITVVRRLTEETFAQVVELFEEYLARVDDDITDAYRYGRNQEANSLTETSDRLAQTLLALKGGSSHGPD